MIDVLLVWTIGGVMHALGLVVAWYLLVIIAPRSARALVVCMGRMVVKRERELDRKRRRP